MTNHEPGATPFPQGHFGTHPAQPASPPKKKGGCLKIGCGGLLAVLLLGMVIAALGGGPKKAPQNAVSTSSAPTSSTSASRAESNTEASRAPSAPTPTTAPAVPVSSEPTGADESATPEVSEPGTADSSTTEESGEIGAAKDAARNYLETMPFSKRGLVQQLSSDAGDKYPLAVATAAVNSLSDVDWSAQATKAARNYLETMPFSKRGLIQQLSSEAGDKYPIADATSAVNSLSDVDWNEQAAKAAKNYLDTMPFSCSALKDQLASESGDKYTPAQAAYGASQTSVCK